MDNNRYRLEILWEGKWRKLWSSENRKPLVEYIQSCPDNLELRIIDTEEEGKANGRRHRPG